MAHGNGRGSLREGPVLLSSPEVHEFIRAELRRRMERTALEAAADLLEREVRELCGKEWSRKEPDAPRRGGSERGRILLEGQQVSVRRPRVRQGGQEFPLQTYRALRSYDVLSEEVQRAMLRGVSTRDYGELLRTVEGGMGLPRSMVSEAFVRASRRSLSEINGRDLSKDLLVALFLDAVEFGGISIVVALGVTTLGRKRVLGLQEGHSENSAVVGALLDNLVERGLALTDVFLAVIDGGKALRKALVQRWKGRVVIQRCQLHKKRNVLDLLPKHQHLEARRRLTLAYGLRDASEAEAELRRTVEWLREISEGAARSLEEGLEETLSVARLGLPDVLRRTFATTNPIESIFASVRHRAGRVKRWRSGRGEMASRWAAGTLLVIERRLYKIRGHRVLAALVEALGRLASQCQREVG